MSLFTIKALKFRGTKYEDFDTFLSQLKLRFSDANITEDVKKTTQTIECLQGTAATWVTDKINTMTADQKVIPDI